MKFEIDNFRCFQKQVFDFSKINILIGENSSGKSSILYFFLALKQSLLSPSHINLTLSGSYIDLGNFSEIIYYHKNKERLSFSFEFHREYAKFYLTFMRAYKDEISRCIGEAIDEPTRLSYSLGENLKDHHTINTEISNSKIGKLVIEHKKQHQQPDRVLPLGEYPKCNLTYSYNDVTLVLHDIEYTKQAFMSLINSQSLKNECNKLPDGLAIFYKVAFLLITQNYLEKFLTKVEYLNPIHSVPLRFHTKRDKATKYSDIDLQNMINILAGDMIEDKAKNLMLENINTALKFYGLVDRIDIKQSKKFPVIELRARVKDLWSSIADVGYGVSLQLPIIFQTILSNSRNGENIFIEQPEAHLHPKLQSKFIETVLEIGSKNTFFIETHSEHIIRKLQVLVKNKQYGISCDDVSIYYFKRQNKKTLVTQHKIDKNGRLINNFDSGFFDSSYLLAKELL